jgi:endogenous inhibitor of DNA gyrase (YacG/DUF329 family)
MSAPKFQVKCPTCRKVGDWFAGPYGPFCSHRCKWIDLGKWLNEEQVISEPLPPEPLDQRARRPPLNSAAIQEED